MDKFFRTTIQRLRAGDDPALAQKYERHHGLLYLRDGDGYRLCVPSVDSLRLQIVQDNHDAAAAGHLGVDKTFDLVHRYYYWPGMYAYIKKFVASCDYCQRAKGSTQPAPGYLASLPIPNERWEEIAMDFVTGLPKTARGYDSICSITDKLSKRVHLVAVHTTDDAADTADMFIRDVFRLHGLPARIVSDRDSRFTSSFWKHLTKRLGTTLRLSTANHPQTDGQSERTNRTVEDMLRCMVQHDQQNWDELLPLVEFAINNSTNAATKMTPFFVDTGAHPRLPQDLLTDPTRLGTPNETANERAERIAHISRLARDHLQYAQDRQALAYNDGRKPAQFKVGDMVLVDIPYLQSATERARPKEKLRFKRTGPYKITARVGHYAYKLDLPAGSRAHPVFNITALRAYNANTIPRRVPPPLPPITLEDGSEEYKVERILKHKKQGRGIKYLTVYSGEREIDATWQPRRNFVDADGSANAVLKKYEREHGIRPPPPPNKKK